MNEPTAAAAPDAYAPLRRRLNHSGLWLMAAIAVASIAGLLERVEAKAALFAFAWCSVLVLFSAAIGLQIPAEPKPDAKGRTPRPLGLMVSISAFLLFGPSLWLCLIVLQGGGPKLMPALCGLFFAVILLPITGELARRIQPYPKAVARLQAAREREARKAQARVTDEIEQAKIAPPVEETAAEAWPLAVRAAVALTFFAAFYLVIIGVALALLLLARSLIFSAPAGRDPKAVENALFGGVACAFAAFGLIAAILPRRLKLEVEGEPLSRSAQPELFAAVEEVARRMEIAPPEEIWLVPEMNASVSMRGGFFGLRATRVLQIGLPLLKSIPLSQLQAMLAHELGHFKGGETRLSGLIYATRMAMIGVLRETGNGLTSRPFRWFLERHLALTAGISRQQELSADKWAARIAGKAAASSMLRSVELLDEAYSFYLKHEIAPLRGLGVQPPVAEGFALFQASGVFRALAQRLANSRAPRSAPFDTHPSFAARLAFLERLPDEAAALPASTEPAAGLVRGLSSLEERLEARVNRPPLPRAGWSGETAAIYAAADRKLGQRVQARISDFSLAKLPALAEPAALEAFALRVRPELLRLGAKEREQRLPEAAVSALACWLGALLEQRGWRRHHVPGELRVLLREGASLAPRDQIEKILAAKGNQDAWQALLAKTELSPSDALTLTEAERSAGEKRVEIRRRALEQGGSELVLGLEQMVLPSVCAHCCGESEFEVPHRFRAGKLEGSLRVPVCRTHLKDSDRALQVTGATEEGVTLFVASAAYADRICAASA